MQTYDATHIGAMTHLWQPEIQLSSNKIHVGNRVMQLLAILTPLVASKLFFFGWDSEFLFQYNYYTFGIKDSDSSNTLFR
jgi:hypothetical protein